MAIAVTLHDQKIHVGDNVAILADREGKNNCSQARASQTTW